MGMHLSPDLTRRCLELAGTKPPPVTERAFMAEVLALARRHGWLSYHPFDSRKSQAGYPDLTLIRGPVLVAAELKVGDNEPTADQITWLELFGGVREVRAELWKPSDWQSIESVLRSDPSCTTPR